MAHDVRPATWQEPLLSHSRSDQPSLLSDDSKAGDPSYILLQRMKVHAALLSATVSGAPTLGFIALAVEGAKKPDRIEETIGGVIAGGFSLLTLKYLASACRAARDAVPE